MTQQGLANAAGLTLLDIARYETGEGGMELSPIFGDGLKDQAAAVWD